MGTKPTGRPRDPAIDTEVLEATRASLEAVGFARTTINEISRRSGVFPSAIYRRWPSRLALIEDAAFVGLTAVEVEPTGDLRGDLRRFLRAYEASLTTPAARAAVPGLLAAYHDGAEPSPSRWLRLSVRPQFEAIVAAAPDQVDPDLDLDDVFDLVLSAVIGRVTIPPIAKRRRRLDHTVELIVRVLRP